MQINHLANFYHVCHCLKTLLFHFGCSGFEILLCFFCAWLIGKGLHLISGTNVWKEVVFL